MIVCACKNINEERIIKEIKTNTSFEDIQMNLGVAMRCGSCRAYVECLIKKHQIKTEATSE